MGDFGPAIQVVIIFYYKWRNRYGHYFKSEPKNYSFAR